MIENKREVWAIPLVDGDEIWWCPVTDRMYYVGSDGKMHLLGEASIWSRMIAWCKGWLGR